MVHWQGTIIDDLNAPTFPWGRGVPTGFPKFARMSSGHIDGVNAENGPPGVGTKSDVVW